MPGSDRHVTLQDKCEAAGATEQQATVLGRRCSSAAGSHAGQQTLRHGTSRAAGSWRCSDLTVHLLISQSKSQSSRAGGNEVLLSILLPAPCGDRRDALLAGHPTSMLSPAVDCCAEGRVWGCRVGCSA